MCQLKRKIIPNPKFKWTSSSDMISAISLRILLWIIQSNRILEIRFRTVRLIKIWSGSGIGTAVFKQKPLQSWKAVQIWIRNIFSVALTHFGSCLPVFSLKTGQLPESVNSKEKMFRIRTLNSYSTLYGPYSMESSSPRLELS